MGWWWPLYSGIWILYPLINLKKTLSNLDPLWQNFLDPGMYLFQSMHWAMPKKDYMLEGNNCEQQTDSSGNTCHSSKSPTDVDSNFINNGNLEEFWNRYAMSFDLRNKFSHGMRFPTMWNMRPAKAQTSLRIRAVWSEHLLIPWIFYDS